MDADEQIAELLLEWEDQFDAGVDVSAEVLCRQFPELISRVAEAIRQLKRSRWMNAPLGTATQSTGLPMPTQQAGQVLLERYRLDSIIGEGAFGEVWRGFDLQLRRPVAIKLPKRTGPATMGADPFLAEAQRVARLRHSGIVSVHDVGRAGAGYFIVSEFIDGCHLGEYVRRRQPTVQDIGRMMTDVATALTHAHAQGFIHRDLKPSNVLVDQHEQVYLADFGIAVSMTSQTGQSAAAGTLAYMAPEQWENSPMLDQRADIYSFGVVLHELLTGQRPFTARTTNELRAQVLSSTPTPPSKLNDSVSKKWDDIVIRCLAKEPGQRFARAEELVGACRAEERLETRECGMSSSWMLIFFLLTVGVLAAVWAANTDLPLYRLIGTCIFVVATIAAAIVLADPTNNPAEQIARAELAALPTAAGLRKGEWPERYQRFQTLRDFPKYPKPLIPAVIDLLQIPSAACRQEVADWLVQVGPDVVPALMVALRESDPCAHDFRRAIVIIFGRLGGAAHDAIPALEFVRRDSSLEHFVDRSLHAIRRQHLPWPKIIIVLLSAMFVACTLISAAGGEVVMVLILALIMGYIGIEATDIKNWQFLIVWLFVIFIGVALIASGGDALGLMWRGLDGVLNRAFKVSTRENGLR